LGRYLAGMHEECALVAARTANGSRFDVARDD
jgi:hypothetical protein